MALVGALPRALRLRTYLVDIRRWAGSSCLACQCQSMDSPQGKKLDNAHICTENGDIVETKLISVANLLVLLENLPPAEKGDNLADRVKKARLSFEKQGYDDMQYSLCRKDRHFVNGDVLDSIFGIQPQAEMNSSPSIDVSHVASNTSEESSNYTFLSRDTPGYAYLEEDSLVNSFSNYMNKSNAHNLSGEILLCQSAARSQKPEEPKTPKDKRPNLDELNLIQDHLNEYLPKCFSHRHDYRIYTPDVIFENNFAEKPFITQGIGPYVREMSKYRMYAHFRYANVKMSVLKSTVHEDEGAVRIRWRISGIPQVRAFMFWKFLPWRYNKAMSSESEWLDGLSTLYVQGGTGIISKHRIDRVQMDKDPAENVVKNPALSMSGTV